jgi:hypothetical protein
MRQRSSDSPGRITVVVSKSRGSDARSRRRACQVRPGEFAGVGETISLVLTGGISVLMCFVGRKDEGRVQEAGWFPE